MAPQHENLRPDDEGPAESDREIRNPGVFGELLREGEAQRLGGMPLEVDRDVLEEIRADFGVDPSEGSLLTQETRTPLERSVPWSRRLRLVLQPMASVAAVAVLFLFARDYLLPAPPATSPAPVRIAEAPQAPGRLVVPNSAAAPEPAIAPEARLCLAAAARRAGQAGPLAALLASVVAAGGDRPGAASVDLPAKISELAAAIETELISGIESVPASVTLRPPRDLGAAFGVWQVELALDAAAAAVPAELVGWRVAIDLGGLDVVAIGDGEVAGFTSPPAYDPSALKSGTIVLAAVAAEAISIDGPVVVARLQARSSADGGAEPMPLAEGTFAAIEQAATP